MFSCFYQVSSTGPAAMKIVSLPLTVIEASAACCLFRSKQAVDIWMYFCQYLNSQPLVECSPFGKINLKCLNTKRLFRLSYHMREDSALRHWDTKATSLIKMGRPAETFQGISVCCSIGSYAIKKQWPLSRHRLPGSIMRKNSSFKNIQCFICIKLYM